MDLFVLSCHNHSKRAKIICSLRYNSDMRASFYNNLIYNEQQNLTDGHISVKAHQVEHFNSRIRENNMAS